MVDLNYNFEYDWLIELSGNKLSDNKVSDNKLSDNNLTSKLVGNRSFFKPIKIEEIVIFVINIFIIKVNKLFSFFSSRCFRKEIENMYSVFLSSYTNTRESLGELEKAAETLACASCSHSISRSPKLPLVFV